MRYTRPYNDKRFVLKNIREDSDMMKNLIRDLLTRFWRKRRAIRRVPGRYERVDRRKAHRNGYKKRGLVTRYGKVELEKPQLC